MALLSVFTCLGFLGFLVFGGWILKSIIGTVHKYWGKSTAWQQLIVATVALFVLFGMVQILGKFDTYFHFLYTLIS